MGPGLLERLGARVTFVVGKGGVGKSTTAGGLALALADTGTHTHLLSTDPAHSVGDLFRHPLGAAPEPSPCTDRLVLEELDAAGVVEARMRALTPGLKELIDRGTYLDLEDADALLGASLPGLDEVGAALRIAGLAGPRLVVDTAPTGHTLRLLQTPDIVRSWLHVFDAMAAKADTVASALMGSEMRLPVEAELERLAEDVAAFEAVAAAADFVVVTAPGRVVAEETARLVRALEDRQLRVAATVAMDRPEHAAAGDRPDADILLPYRRGLAGCEALRSWWRDTPGPEARAPVAARSEPAPSGGGLPEGLQRELVVFAGKGGVGKTTCAAAAAVRLARSSPVLLMGSDPAGSLYDVLGGRPVAGLTVRELEGERELERIRSLYRAEVDRAFEATGLGRSARLDRAVVESLWQLAPPGLDELVGISRLAAESEAEPRIVLDTAPTGHFLRLMAMPELALDWVRRIMRILLKYSAAGDLDAPAGELLRFARRFRTLRERLTDGERTAIFIVTLDEPLVRAETDRLAGRLRALRLPLAGVIVNRAAGPVAARPDVPTWRAPEVEDPSGARSLEEFTRAWERIE